MLAGAAGERYLVLLTDDGGDFCEDSTPNCALDAAIASLQLAAAEGITTIVVAVESTSNYDYALEYMAMAGLGEEPAWEEGLRLDGYRGSLESQCLLAPALWGELRADRGHAPDPSMCGDNQSEDGNTACHLPAGKYSEQGGSAQFVSGKTGEELAAALIDRLSGLDSCEQ